jgi:hypothetical protein
MFDAGNLTLMQGTDGNRPSKVNVPHADDSVHTIIHCNDDTGIGGGQQYVLTYDGTVVQTAKPFVVAVNWTVV